MNLLLSKASPDAVINPIAVDYHQSNELKQHINEAMAAHGPVDLAVFWIHSDAPDAFRVIADEIYSHTDNAWRLFHVRGSNAHFQKVAVSSIYPNDAGASKCHQR